MSKLSPHQFKYAVGGPGVNQMAFPGMEEGAHPGAALVSEKAGGRLDYERAGTNAYDPEDQKDSHVLFWRGPSDEMGSRASLRWRGTNPSHEEGFPGEIEWVHTLPPHRRQGVASALFNVATQMDLGQSTRPVHSPSRTDDGYEWSKKAGGPRGKLDHYPLHTDPDSGKRVSYVGKASWEVPEGYHPYENDLKPKSKKVDPHQGRLF